MWLSISVYSPQPDHFVAVFDDVTARRRGEECIRRQNAVLAGIEHVGDDFGDHGPGGRLTSLPFAAPTPPAQPRMAPHLERPELGMWLARNT